MKIKKFDEQENINESVVNGTFSEIDKKFGILNKETISWIKSKIQWHISEAYQRGVDNGRNQE